MKTVISKCTGGRLRAAVLAGLGLALFSGQTIARAANPIPRIVSSNGRHALLVDGAPFLIMIQVENEPGAWGSIRDYSPEAERVFAAPVPAQFLTALGGRNGANSGDGNWHVTTMKEFFADRGIKTSAGLGLTANEPNGFQSYCYSTPADCEKVKAMTEFTARHFDEIILDDFFFSNCKCDRCIAAKGDKSWTRFRTEQLDDVSRDLIIGPAKAINPKVRVIIKYPNWYESFQGLGYDLAVEPKLYDAIYTGTETRDANSGQHLQSYQSYLQAQYFNNIKPGGNQGG
jgi:hypothetical protein